MNPKDLNLDNTAISTIRRDTGAKLWVWDDHCLQWLEKHEEDSWIGSASKYLLQKEKPTSPP